VIKVIWSMQVIGCAFFDFQQSFERTYLCLL
jgi:hypothetical protein